MELKFFGTDEFKSNLVIFYIDRGESLNAYVWVYRNGRVRVTNIYAVASYCNHSVSPFYVKEDVPQGLIDNAYETLDVLGKEEREKLLQEFNHWEEMISQNEKEYAEREEYEDGVIEELEKKRNSEDGLFWLM